MTFRRILSMHWPDYLLFNCWMRAKFFVFDSLQENEIYTLFGKKWLSETLRLTLVKNMISWYWYRTHVILGWLSYTWNPGMAIVLRLLPLFGEKCLLLADKVNYDRPFMDHIERKKYRSYSSLPIMGEFFWHALDCVLRPKTSIRSLPTSFRTLAEIVLRRKNANRDVQNTFKSPVLFLQKIEKSHFTKDL